MTSEVIDSGYVKCVGQDNKHLKVTVSQSNSSKINCIGFGLGDQLEIIKNKNPFKIVYSIIKLTSSKRNLSNFK